MLVAVFLVVSISRGVLEGVWAVVALSDGVVAVVQIVILRKGWWREVLP
jgi:Na+-driven multidrug efflux pump